MNIVAIGGTSSDLEIGCLGTLSKFQKQGHQVSIIAVGKKKMWTKRAINAFKEIAKKIGTSQVYFTERFDYSGITQDNVNVIRSIIEPLHPSVSIIPFNEGSDKKTKVISESSLLASRNIANVLMYEIHRNKNFFPNVYFVLDNKTYNESSYGKLSDKDVKKKSLNNESKSIHRFYPTIGKIGKPVEAFASHRTVLLNGNILGGT
jgi:hypothetical protein